VPIPLDIQSTFGRRDLPVAGQPTRPALIDITRFWFEQGQASAMSARSLTS